MKSILCRYGWHRKTRKIESGVITREYEPNYITEYVWEYMTCKHCNKQLTEKVLITHREHYVDGFIVEKVCNGNETKT